MRKVNNIRRCRLCACEESFNNFLNIFDDNPELDLEIKITKLLPIVVMPWDPMPHIICQECISKLNSFNDFYEASLKAERFLRTLQPSAPETELESVEPVVRVMDPSTPNRDSFKLPPKKRQSSDCHRMDTDPGEFGEVLRPPDEQANEPFAKRPLDSFIINHITTRDSVFTCRACYRTFTKQSAALTHSCVTLEDCAEVLSENGEKSLPPLKIRLFSEKSGVFICYLCQTPFERKAELVGHIKGHFVEDLQAGKKSRQTGKRRGRHKKGEDDDDNDDGEEANRRKAPVKKPRKSTDTPKKRGRKKAAEPCEDGPCEKCGKTQESPKTPARETVERMTQCSEVASSSEVKDEEVEILPYPDDDDDSVEMLPMNKQTSETNASEDRTGIFETNWSPSLSPLSSFGDRVTEVPSEQDNEPPNVTGTGKDKSDEPADKSDEVTVLEVISNKTPTTFSSCVFCDKIFTTKDALIAHQNKHLQNYNGTVRSETNETDTFLCSVCAMTFTHRKTLLDHEQFHRVEEAVVDKIRIALNPESQEQAVEQECHISKGHGVLTITVTSRERKMTPVKWM